MATFNLGDLFIPTELVNSAYGINNGINNPAFKTVDRVYLDIPHARREIATCTDYAVMNGAYYREQKASCWYRTGQVSSHLNPSSIVHCNSPFGEIKEINAYKKYPVIRPIMHVDVNAFLQYRDLLTKLGNHDAAKIHQNGDLRQVTFGLEFPSEHVDQITCNYLDTLHKKRKLRKTDKTYFGHINYLDHDIRSTEYEHLDQKYVRTQVKRFDEKEDPFCVGNVHFHVASRFNNKTSCPATDKFTWAKVQPIDFTIRNWDDLSQSINPQGTGKATYMEVIAERGMLAMPFALDFDEEGLWQNSLPRAYLNGYDLYKEISHGNGNRKYRADINHDYTTEGFLYEASQNLRERYNEIILDLHPTKLSKQSIATRNKAQNLSTAPQQPRIEQSNPYGFTYDELDNDDLLRLYIQSKTPVFLHGPSGVGKSSRVKQIDPNPTHITLRPQMNPEEVDGTLDRETGKYIPPLWYTQLCEKCDQDPAHIHTLFIDELTNVKPTVQSLVYSIILDRAGKDGLWPLPDNSVVVAAGNENADNLAAYPLTNALFRRFSHIYYQVDKETWLDWAMGVNKLSRLMPVAPDKAKHARIHPAILGFVMSQKKNILHQNLDEENPKIVTDPRKWEIASNVLYATKNPYALQPAVGEEITASFIKFVRSTYLTVADVVNGNYHQPSLHTMNFSEKYATAVGLCNATEKDLPVVRNFIQRYLGQEIRAVYDSLWIRNNPERAAIIAELDEPMTLESVNSNDIERAC